MISPILAKLYKCILEKKIGTWLEIHGKRTKGQARFRGRHPLWTTLLQLGSLKRSAIIIKLISFAVSLINSWRQLFIATSLHNLHIEISKQSTIVKF
jgi:hypothetical protein